MLVVPDTIVTDVASSTVATSESVLPLLLLLVSIPVAFYVARKILAMFPKSRTR